MKLFQSMALMLLVMPQMALGGNLSPRQKAIWNYGSGYAFMSQCAAKGYTKIEPVEKLGRLYQQALTEQAYAEWLEVFQRTLHEKRMYSIVKDEWLPYQVTPSTCKDMERLAEMFALRLSSSN